MSLTTRAKRWIDTWKRNEASKADRPWAGLEALEHRLLLAGDLVGFFDGDVSFPTPIVPGDKIDIPVIIENIGDMEAEGEIRIDFYAVPRGGTIDDAPEPFAEIEDIEGSLDPFDDADFRLKGVFPFDEELLPPGEYDLLGEIVVIEGVGDENDSNNVITFIKNTTDRVEFTVAWQFGNVPGRSSNTKLIAINEDDDPQDPEAGEVVTASLTGAGYGEVIFDGDESDGTIRFFETDASTKVKLTVKGGDGEVEIGNLEAENPVGSFDGEDVLLQGNADFMGGIEKLILGNVGEDENDLDDGDGEGGEGNEGDEGPEASDSPHSITIGGLVEDKPVTIELGIVENLSLTSNRPIKSLKVVEWLEDDESENVLMAPSLDKLEVKGERGSGHDTREL